MKKSVSLTARIRNAVLSKTAAGCALGLSVTALLANVAEAQQRQVPILLYGPVEAQAQSEYWVSTSNFQAHMSQLKSRGYTTITIGEYVNHIKNPTANPITAEKPVILTFTNGYKNARTVVDPILAQHGFKATAFLLPAYIGQNNSWDVEDEGGLIQHLTWADVDYLEGTGRWEFGSHTSSHVRLTTASAAVRQSEIAGSKTTIENQIDGTVRYFSYPNGLGTQTSAIRGIIQNAGYEAALGVVGQDATSHNDPLALPRLYVTSNVTVNDLFGPQYLNDSSSGGGDFVAHPGDTNNNREIDANELSSYAQAWLTGAHTDADILSVGAQIWLNGGKYTYNGGASGALRWVSTR